MNIIEEVRERLRECDKTRTKFLPVDIATLTRWEAELKSYVPLVGPPDGHPRIGPQGAGTLAYVGMIVYDRTGRRQTIESLFEQFVETDVADTGTELPTYSDLSATPPTPATERRYAGDASRDFWDRINATNDAELYQRACDLQNLESEILRSLASREVAPPEPATKAPPIPAGVYWDDSIGEFCGNELKAPAFRSRWYARRDDFPTSPVTTVFTCPRCGGHESGSTSSSGEPTLYWCERVNCWAGNKAAFDAACKVKT